MIKILVVDDRPENLRTMSKVLEDLSLDIHLTGSGEEALSLTLEHDYAVVLLDVQMPEMDGFEVATLLRGRQKTRSLPIIFVTAANPDRKLLFQGYELGAVDVLFKPYDPFVLRNKVKVFAELATNRESVREQLRLIEQQQDQLRDALEEAEAANRAKTQFLANMSHEIRSPLAAILGFTELLRTEVNSPEDVAQSIEVIERNGTILAALVDDILDLSKVEAGKLQLEFAEVSLADILDDVIATLALKASSKGLTLIKSHQGITPEKIKTDPLRLKQILLNIMGNAVKFTSRGQVVLNVSYEQDDNAGLLTFDVQDTGVGIEYEQAAKLFEPFRQSDASTTRKFGGTGLGLALARRFARALGGDVVLVRSQLQGGALFRITVRVETIKAFEKKISHPIDPQRDENQSQPLNGLQVLLAEDLRDNQVLISRFLEGAGAQVSLASNGQEAVEQAMSQPFDIVLMDVQMPKMDGCEATTELRSRGYRKPIIALTAHAFREEKKRLLDAGCNAHIPKPVNRKLLIDEIVKMTNAG
jgi:two-component system, sensor histidine kinase